MAMDFASIKSKEYADTLLKAGKPEQIDQEPIGTGPFELVAVPEGQRRSAIRRSTATGARKPKIDTLVFSITKDPAVRLAKLRANECQVVPYPEPGRPAEHQGRPERAADEPARAEYRLSRLQQPKKPFDDVRVRRAINMAIDKKAILDAVYQGAGQPAKNLIPPTMWCYNDAMQDYPYDPDAAKKLLAEAGLPDGFETDLWAMPVQRPYNPDGKRIAELMQSDLAKVGIKAKIISYEWGEYRKRAQAGEHQMVELGWTGDNGDPDNFFVPLAGCGGAKPGGSNIAKWCDKPFDDSDQQGGDHDRPGGAGQAV